MIEELIREMRESMAALSEALISAESHQFLHNEWNASEIAAHMLHVEIMFLERIQRLANNENPHFSYYLNTGWNFDAYELHATLREWGTWRDRLITLVCSLTSAQLAFTGTHDHFETVTAVDFMKIANSHDLEHLEDLKKKIG